MVLEEAVRMVSLLSWFLCTAGSVAVECCCCLCMWLGSCLLSSQHATQKQCPWPQLLRL